MKEINIFLIKINICYMEEVLIIHAFILAGLKADNTEMLLAQIIIDGLSLIPTVYFLVMKGNMSSLLYPIFVMED